MSFDCDWLGLKDVEFISCYVEDGVIYTELQGKFIKPVEYVTFTFPADWNVSKQEIEEIIKEVVDENT